MNRSLSVLWQKSKHYGIVLLFTILMLLGMVLIWLGFQLLPFVAAVALSILLYCICCEMCPYLGILFVVPDPLVVIYWFELYTLGFLVLVNMTVWMSNILEAECIHYRYSSYP